MSKKIIYTVGYTLFQKGNAVDVEGLFRTLHDFGVQYLVDVRSVPFSKHYPQCDAPNMKIAGRNFGIRYMNMVELGAKVESSQDVFTKASDIFFEDVFPIPKSKRPEKTELLASEEIVDFQKFRHGEMFRDGLKRIETAYDQDLTLCLMCSEKKPMECHRYFLVSHALEQNYGEWLEVRHIVEDGRGGITTLANEELAQQLKKSILSGKRFNEATLLQPDLSGEAIIDNYFGDTVHDKLYDFCDRYWNLMHGWKRYNNTNTYEE